MNSNSSRTYVRQQERTELGNCKRNGRPELCAKYRARTKANPKARKLAATNGTKAKSIELEYTMFCSYGNPAYDAVKVAVTNGSKEVLSGG